MPTPKIKRLRRSTACSAMRAYADATNGCDVRGECIETVRRPGQHAAWPYSPGRNLSECRSDQRAQALGELRGGHEAENLAHSLGLHRRVANVARDRRIESERRPLPGATGEHLDELQKRHADAGADVDDADGLG